MNQQRSEPAPSPAARSRRIDTASWLLRQARRRQRSGQAMTEFTLVVPILLLVIYAMIIFALAIHTQIDFGNAVSTAVRKATVLGNGSTLPPAQVGTGAAAPVPNLEDVDSLIGQSMTSNLRSDDKGSIDSFDIQLEQSRIMPDALNNPDHTGTAQNIYKNTYCAIPAPSSAPAACKAVSATASVYGSGNPTFDQNAWDFIQANTGSIDPCQYYYEAHQSQVLTYDGVANKQVDTATTYLDAREQIVLYQTVVTYPPLTSTPASITRDFRYPNPASYTAPGGFQSGCNRVYYVENRPAVDQIPPVPVGSPTSYSVDWDCTYANAPTNPPRSYVSFIPITILPALPSPFDARAVGHTCYYYPNERNIDVSSASDFPLPDLVEVGLNYHYDPIPTEISSKTPLGQGFSLREHARGRLEPAPIPGG